MREVEHEPVIGEGAGWEVGILDAETYSSAPASITFPKGRDCPSMSVTEKPALVDGIKSIAAEFAVRCRFRDQRSTYWIGTILSVTPHFPEVPSNSS